MTVCHNLLVLHVVMGQLLGMANVRSAASGIHLSKKKTLLPKKNRSNR